MRILAILTYYHPHWTGLTVHARRVCEGLAARGHEVTVLTSRFAPELPARETIEGVRVVRLPTAFRVSRGMLQPSFPVAATRLIRRADVVHVHTPLPEAGLVGWLCRREAKPLVMTHHGDVVMPSGPTGRIVEKLARRLLTSVAREATAVTSYSLDYAESSALLSPFADKLVAIAPPVTLPPPDPEAVARRRDELGLVGAEVIGFAGRWVAEKGFDVLLEAFPRLLATHPNARLVFAGERAIAYERTFAESRAQVAALGDRLIFLGLVREPQAMADFYALADVFCLPSRTDMFALVQVEAMLSGTPVVASDIPGARVVVGDTGFGRLAPAENPEALADALAEVLENPERYRPVRSTLEAAYAPDRAYDAYEQLLARVLRPAAPVPDARVRRVLPRVPTTLSLPARRRLDVLLRNEVDTAFARRARLLLDWLELDQARDVLDCGCGMGFYLMAIGALAPGVRLTGIDQDPGRLAWARGEGVVAALLRADLERIPLADASVDRVLASEVLEHVADDARTLAEMFRVLRPGGVLALSVPHARYPFWWDPINATWTALGGQPIREGWIAGIWSQHERLYDPGPLAAAIERAGFELEIVAEATHASFPFQHFLVYGIGKPLLEHGLLPETLRDSADRFRGERNRGSLWNPINLTARVFRAIDRRNDRPGVVGKTTFVNVLVKARKPGATPAHPADPCRS